MADSWWLINSVTRLITCDSYPSRHGPVVVVFAKVDISRYDFSVLENVPDKDKELYLSLQEPLGSGQRKQRYKHSSNIEHVSRPINSTNHWNVAKGLDPGTTNLENRLINLEDEQSRVLM